VVIIQLGILADLDGTTGHVGSSYPLETDFRIIYEDTVGDGTDFWLLYAI
jgi:hypothetical protein